MIAFLLSVVFLTAAMAKLDDLWAFRLTVRELLPAAPRALTQALAVAVIAAEMLVAALFITGSRSLGITAAVGTCALAVVFAAAYLLSRRVPHGVPCRCFGAFAIFGLTKLSIRTVVLAIILISAAAVWAGSHGDLATFAGYAFRLLALVPALAIPLVNRVRSSRPDIRPVPADAPAEMDGARN